MLSILVVLYWTCYRYLSDSGGEEAGHCFGCSLMGTKKLEVITSLRPLVMLLLLQFRMLLAFVMLGHNTSSCSAYCLHSPHLNSSWGPFQQSWSPAWQSLTCTLAMKLFIPRCRTLQLSVFNSLSSLLSHSSSLSLWTTALTDKSGCHHLLEIVDKDLKHDSSLQTFVIVLL